MLNPRGLCGLGYSQSLEGCFCLVLGFVKNVLKLFGHQSIYNSLKPKHNFSFYRAPTQLTPD